MFRELTRKNKMISRDECIQLLKSEKRGVLSVNGDDGYPYGMPINHFYNEDDGRIYFHCGTAISHRLDALRRDDRVSFCVYDEGYRKPGQWALNIRSVIVFGRATIIDDMDAITEIAARLSRKFTLDEEYIASEIEKNARRTLLIALSPEHICGKLVEES